MSTFKPFAIARVDFGPNLGEAWMETPPGTTVADITKMIWSGEREGVQQVLLITEIGKPVEDVTSDIAIMLAERIDGEWATNAAEHHEDLLNFCEVFSQGWKRPRTSGRAA